MRGLAVAALWYLFIQWNVPGSRWIEMRNRAVKEKRRICRYSLPHFWIPNFPTEFVRWACLWQEVELAQTRLLYSFIHLTYETILQLCHRFGSTTPGVFGMILVRNFRNNSRCLQWRALVQKHPYQPESFARKKISRIRGSLTNSYICVSPLGN